MSNLNFSFKKEEELTWYKCRKCHQDYKNLRENGLCVKCDPWETKVYEKPKTKYGQAAEVVEDMQKIQEDQNG